MIKLFSGNKKSQYNNQECFSKMCKKEKKKFLSNDFIDRMIRVEQRLSLTFGAYIPYNKTKYYKSLCSEEKKVYEDYLKKRKNGWRVVLLFVFIGIIAIAVLKTGFTGNAVNDRLGEDAISAVSYTIVFLMLVLVFLSGIILFFRRKRENDFNNKFQVIDKIVSSRRVSQ